MSVRTVRELSGEWHEAVALAEHDTTTPLPEPWRDAEKLNGWNIIPLSTAGMIAAEGRAMHHCAGSYIEKVGRGETYLYSVREDDRPIATIEVAPYGNSGVSIQQMRGPCNAILPKPMQGALIRWVRQKDKWQLPQPRAEDRPIWSTATDDGLEELPF